jgi:hypothetical protein
MGFLDIDICIFTGEKAQAIINSIAAVEYFVTINGKQHLIRYSNLQTDNPFFIKNKNIFYALLYNDDWFEDEQTFITIQKLEKLLASKSFSTTPEDKLDRLFLKLFSFQQEDGQIVKPAKGYFDNILWKILYFKSLDELNYYSRVLSERNLIDATYSNTKERPGLLEAFRITFKGLNYEIQLKEEGDKSNKCFIAMSFKEETREIRNAIKSALDLTGFVPILIDEQNIDSDRTINDEIIANLKRCKFCIADFTFHSMGVYFESGHALGQGKKVIYTCRYDEFVKAHFDIRPLQHIIYETTEQLTKDLVNKIDAWIK